MLLIFKCELTSTSLLSDLWVIDHRSTQICSGDDYTGDIFFHLWKISQSPLDFVLVVLEPDVRQYLPIIFVKGLLFAEKWPDQLYLLLCGTTHRKCNLCLHCETVTPTVEEWLFPVSQSVCLTERAFTKMLSIALGQLYKFPKETSHDAQMIVIYSRVYLQPIRNRFFCLPMSFFNISWEIVEVNLCLKFKFRWRRFTSIENPLLH